MEVKVGIKDSVRELVISSTESPDAIEKSVADALANTGSLFRLVDEKGRTYLVPADRIAYVEIAHADARKVGFAS